MMLDHVARKGCWFAVEVEADRFIAIGGNRAGRETGRLDLSPLVGTMPEAELYREAFRWGRRHGWLRRALSPRLMGGWTTVAR